MYLQYYKLVYYRCVLVGRYQWPMGFTTFRLMMIYLIHKLLHYWQSWSSPWQIILNYLLKSEWVCWEHWQHQSSYMAVKLRPSKQRLQVHQCLWDELHVEDVTGLLLFTHHKQTSYENWWRDIGNQENVDNSKKKLTMFLFSLTFYIII